MTADEQVFPSATQFRGKLQEELARNGGEAVIFVHGYAGTEHIWGPLRSALTEAGFGCLIALRYNAFRADIHQIADWLVDWIARNVEKKS